MSFKFKDIFRFIQANLRHFDRFAEVEYAAINGMLATLDPHSALLRPEDYREMKASTRGKFGGLGIVVSLREGHLTIVNPIPDTPATRAGLKAGDRIVQIGEDSTVNMALQDAVDLLRGDANTKVDIWISREGWKAPKRFPLMRASIKVKSVDSMLLADRVGLVRIKNFQNTPDDELGEALGSALGVGEAREDGVSVGSALALAEGILAHLDDAGAWTARANPLSLAVRAACDTGDWSTGVADQCSPARAMANTMLPPP
jgi:carboxyl-terminal processing protease